MRTRSQSIIAWLEPYAGSLLSFFLPFFISVAFVRLTAAFYLHLFHHFPEIWQYFPHALLYDLKAVLLLTLFLAPFICLFRRRKGWYGALVHGPVLLLLLCHMGLTFYYVTILDPLDKAVLLHSWGELFLVWEEFGGFRPLYLLLLLPPLIYLASVRWVSFPARSERVWRLPLLFLLFLLPFGLSSSLFPERKAYLYERHYELVNNKSLYFISSLLQGTGKQQRTMSLQDAVRRFQASRKEHEFTDPEHPLVHRAREGSNLAPFFDLKEQPPNLVFVIVEGLGRAISGKNAHLQSFTPFLDSLANESLYFPNFMSTGERTFSVLPAALGSLPHGSSGFINTKGKLPSHYTVPSLLIGKGYEGAFFYGGDASYSSYGRFMKEQGVRYIYDCSDLKKAPGEKEGKKGSMNDRELFERGLKVLRNKIGDERPYVHTYLTLSMHHPFRFEGQGAYIEKLEKRIEARVGNKKLRQRFRTYKEALSTVLYTDDVLKDFIKRYTGRPEYENSIFFIFGDHRLSQMKKRGPLDTYHIPLIIHSPLLKEARTFPALNSQLDLPPAIISLLRTNYELELPKDVPWLGSDLDTNAEFRSRRTFPIMLNNGEMKQYLYREHFLSYDKLYEIQKGMKGVISNDREKLIKLRKEFRAERIVGDHVVRNGCIVPPSSDVQAKSKVLISAQERKARIGPKAGFEMLLEDSLNKDLKELQISIDIPFVGDLEGLDDKQIPLLVIVLKASNGEKLFWNGIDIKEASVRKEGWRRVFSVERRIGEKAGRTLNKGQRIKVYFWKQRPSKRAFKYQVRKLQVKGVLE